MIRAHEYLADLEGAEVTVAFIDGSDHRFTVADVVYLAKAEAPFGLIDTEGDFISWSAIAAIVIETKAPA